MKKSRSESEPLPPWQPSLCAKQFEILNNDKRFLLASGPRQTGKTFACENKVAKHLWQTSRAQVAVVTKSIAAGADSGTWEHLTSRVLPAWVDGGFGMEWVKPPTQHGVTKRMYSKVTNGHGNVSTVELHSLKHEQDVEEFFKNKNFTMIYVTELDLYKDMRTFLTWIAALRGGDEGTLYQAVFDTNPAPEGKNSWIYKLWYELRVQRDVPDNQKALRDNLGLIETRISDNPYLSKAQVDLLYSQYSSNPDLKARYLDGLWTTTSEDALFSHQLRPSVHFIGELPTQDEPNPEQLVPERDCITLIGGCDIGDINPAVALLEKYPVDTLNGEPISAFKVLDEIIHISEEVPTWDFAEEVVDRMDFWERQMNGRQPEWVFWSDISAMNRYRAASGSYDHQIVEAASGGRIILRPFVERRMPGSVTQRVKLLRALLHDNRIFINRARCPHICEMLQSLRARAPGSFVLHPGSRLKHAFDALTYALLAECMDEVVTANQPRTNWDDQLAGVRLVL